MRKARFALLTLLLTFNLYANFLINDHLVSPKASDYINKMGSELKQKTNINGYIVATNDKLERGISVYDYINKYSSSLSKPFVAIVFVPNSQRIHLIAEPKELLKGLDKSEILDNAIGIIASKDSNSKQSKYDVGLVQAYSEMADEIAKVKGVKLNSTIKAGGSWVLKIVNTLIIVGSIVVIWLFFIAPFIRKLKAKS